MDTGKIVFWSVLGVVAVGGGYLIYNQYFKKPEPAPVLPPETKPEGSTMSIDNLNLKGDNFPLTVGSRGANVARLQNALLAVGAKQVVADGIFGSKTLNASRAIYQKPNMSSVTEQDVKNLELRIAQKNIPASVLAIMNKF